MLIGRNQNTVSLGSQKDFQDVFNDDATRENAELALRVQPRTFPCGFGLDLPSPGSARTCVLITGSEDGRAECNIENSTSGKVQGSNLCNDVEIDHA